MTPAHSTIGPYVITRELGRGGMGIVYEAVDPRIDHRVAIKVLAQPTQSGMRRRLEKEARALVRTSHPGLVKLLLFDFLPDGSPYIVLEYLDGETLRERMNRYKKAEQLMPLRELLILAEQLANTLSFVHQLGMIHRDVKPENVKLTSDASVPGGERVKLIDFGIVKLSGDGEAVTRPDRAPGTAPYMAPECWRAASRVDSKIDVYALGIVIYELATGHCPYSVEESEALQGCLEEKLVPAHERSPRVPESLSWLISGMLAVSARARPAAEQVAEQFRDIAQELERAQQVDPAQSQPQTDSYSVKPADSRLRGALGWPRVFPARKKAGVYGAPVALLAALTALPWVRLKLTAMWMWRKERATGANSQRILIPGGEFRMGSTEDEIAAKLDQCQRLRLRECNLDRFGREYPKRTVRLAPFYLDPREVTQQEFANWLNSQPGLRPKDDRLIYSGEMLWADLLRPNTVNLRWYRDHFEVLPGFQHRPMAQVTWYAAEAYCAQHDGRLPTEAEYEYVAGSRREYPYPWGADPPDCAGTVFARTLDRTCGHLPFGAANVGTSRQDRSQDQIYDLAGNVAEWVADAYGDQYPPCKKEPCENPLVRPEGLAPRTPRVVRGGDWNATAQYSSATTRSRQLPDETLPNVGFRCAKSLPHDRGGP